MEGEWSLKSLLTASHTSSRGVGEASDSDFSTEDMLVRFMSSSKCPVHCPAISLLSINVIFLLYCKNDLVAKIPENYFEKKMT